MHVIISNSSSTPFILMAPMAAAYGIVEVSGLCTTFIGETCGAHKSISVDGASLWHSLFVTAK